MKVTIEQMLGEESEVVVCCSERKKIEVVEIRGDVKDELARQGCERHCCGRRLDMIVYIPTLDRRHIPQGRPHVLSCPLASRCSFWYVPFSLPCPPNPPPLAPYAARTHDCGSLCATDVGSRVVLAGWLLPQR